MNRKPVTLMLNSDDFLGIAQDYCGFDPAFIDKQDLQPLLVYMAKTTGKEIDKYLYGEMFQDALELLQQHRNENYIVRGREHSLSYIHDSTGRTPKN